MLAFWVDIRQRSERHREVVAVRARVRKGQKNQKNQK